MEQYLQKQIKLLWTVIYILAVITFISLGFGVYASTANDGENGYVRKGPYRTEITQINQRLNNADKNINGLFKNDSVIVVNQQKIQNGQRATNFLGFLAKLAL